MDLRELKQRFDMPGVLAIDEDRGLTRIRITSPAARATLYLQGAHVTEWQPTGAEPVIFLSRQSEFGPGKAIRGGIPIVFPWFAGDRKLDRVNGQPGPSHGFARIQDWTLESATRHGDDIALRLALGPTAMSRSMGFDHFLLTLDAVFGAAFRLTFTVKNLAGAPLSFEEALHAYFRVVDVHEATVLGLEPTSYLDKTDGGALKPPSRKPIEFMGTVDRVYLDTSAACTIHDGAQRRDIHIEKVNSQNTVVFTPYHTMPDLGEWDWHEMVCVETANVGNHGPVLAPGASGSMGVHVTVTPWAAR